MIMYISRRFEKNICATLHYEALKELYGANSIVTIDLTPGSNRKGKNVVVFPKYNKLEKFKRYMQLNTYQLNSSIIRTISDMVGEYKIQKIFFDESYFGKLVRRIKKDHPHVKLTVFYHDIERILYWDWVKKRGLSFVPDFLTVSYNEFLTAKHADQNLVLNERDARLYEKVYRKRPDGLLPMAVASPDFSASERVEMVGVEKKYKHLILLVGAYYYPNLNGLRWFADHVMKQLSDDYLLVVVGRGMEKVREEYTNFSNIYIVGGVESLAAYYNNADIVVAPIFEGGGMKQKTAEAFGYGRCFVGTTESLEGYEEELSYPFVFRSDSAEGMLAAFKEIEKNQLYGYHAELNAVFRKKYSKEAMVQRLQHYMGE